MAVKWAVANEGWSSGATWNDGVVPTTDDDVYLNGHIINGGTGTGIKRLSANFITNGANADYGIVAGGHITIVLNNTTFNCGLVQKGNETLIVGSFGNQNKYFNIEGDVSNEDGYVISFSGAVGLIITINGSVNIGGMYSIFASNTNLNMQYSLNLNCPQYHSSNNIAIISHANVELTATSFTLVGGVFENFNKGTGTVTTLTANVSEIIITSNLAVTTANITGKLSCRNNAILEATILNIFGQIEYKSTNNTLGVRITNLNIQNPDTFTWKDITEPRSNPFFIVTECELNDTYLYPSASVVRDGIQYAANQRTGTYRPDYPIPQNVMKDVEYDSGLLIGTLEFPQAPTTSDIVNAIKNDSDLGGKIDTTNTNVGNISTAVTTIDGKVDIIDTNVDTLLSRLTSVLTQRLGQSVTVEILQQILVAHLNN